MVTFRFDAFLPEENYTTNATIQLHPENNEVVDDIKNAIMDMINFQIEKDDNDDVKIQVRNFFFSSRSLKMRDKYISFAHLVLLSLYIFSEECVHFSIFGG